MNTFLIINLVAKQNDLFYCLILLPLPIDSDIYCLMSPEVQKSFDFLLELLLGEKSYQVLHSLVYRSMLASSLQYWAVVLYSTKMWMSYEQNFLQNV